MKKILIIGASGFVGKSLISFFLSKKKYYIYSISRKKISLKNKFLKKITLDLKNLRKLPTADNIFYLINSKTLDIEKKNFFHFKNLLEQSSNKPKIILSSSGSVYGFNLRYKKFKENNKINRSKILKFKNYKKEYSFKKIFLENEFKQLGKNKNNVSIARCFSFYGKNILEYKYIISEIINSIIKKKDIIFKDKSKVLRSYMHQKDMANWLYKICENANEECPIYNVGSDETINLKVFAKKISRLYKICVRFTSNDHENDDVYLPDVSLAKNELNLKIERRLQNDIKIFDLK